jgi:hypothetical protein
MDDPLRLREILTRARALADRHALCSSLVGVAGLEGDPLFPEIVHFLESGLRVDDSVFRMTRERVVLLLTDADAAKAASIVGRLLEDFSERFPSASEPAVAIHTFEVAPGAGELTLKQVLPLLFPGPPATH